MGSLQGAFWVFYNGVQTPEHKYVIGVFSIDFVEGTVAQLVCVPQDKQQTSSSLLPPTLSGKGKNAIDPLLEVCFALENKP